MSRGISYFILSAFVAMLIGGCGVPTNNLADTLPYSPYSSTNPYGTSGTSFQVTASPSSTAAVGQTITLSPVNYATGDSFTYTQISPTSPAVSLAAGPSGSAYVTSPVAMSVVIQITDTMYNASTELSLSFTGGSTVGGALSCTLTHIAGVYYPGQQVIFNISTSDGEAVEVTSWNAGEPWAIVPPFPLLLPIEATYSYPGVKYVSLTAQGLSSGQPCNGGAPLQDVVQVY